ncbi:conserved hypothetical protein ['Nostoc azollae' 0708]|jgi:hypothetical protein|uniref:Uncharacterized protein n=1 Tax=Nostoc azollae (strain 0708) TaxID=551115 RepID=D7DVY4_NOSA0|nr:conserved hypothetical protein ['Nostoc azollae' 0708]
MDELIASALGEHSKTLVKQRNHLLHADGEERLNYAKDSAPKLPIGSGAMGSLIRQVVNLRMKGNSEFWLRENGQIILHRIAGSWHNFCNSIFISFIHLQTV